MWLFATVQTRISTLVREEEYRVCITKFNYGESIRKSSINDVSRSALGVQPDSLLLNGCMCHYLVVADVYLVYIWPLPFILRYIYSWSDNNYHVSVCMLINTFTPDQTTIVMFPSWKTFKSVFNVTSNWQAQYIRIIPVHKIKKDLGKLVPRLQIQISVFKMCT